MGPSKKVLLITDITRMWSNRVCVAGINSDGNSIRPIFDGSHITENWLYTDEQLTIYPFSRVAFRFLKHRPDNPHSEDWIIDPDFKHKVDTASQGERRRLLRKFSDKNVASIFGAEIQHNPGSYIREGEGNRSLGTIKATVVDFSYGINFNRWDYRITFVDQADQVYSLKVTDLSFRYYCDFMRDKEKIGADKISKQLKRHMGSNLTFLRIGLARPNWDQYPHCCFLQITGVYTFPDYLDGRCFADFKRP
jgi:hypothetical protein